VGSPRATIGVLGLVVGMGLETRLGAAKRQFAAAHRLQSVQDSRSAVAHRGSGSSRHLGKGRKRERRKGENRTLESFVGSPGPPTKAIGSFNFSHPLEMATGSRTTRGKHRSSRTYGGPKRKSGSTRRSIAKGITYTDTIVVGAETFKATLILQPTMADTKTIHALFEGNRLDITPKIIDKHVKDKDYLAILAVENTDGSIKDRAVATLQYAAWCPTDGVKKMWIHDISRISTSRGTHSPVQVLVQYAKTFTDEHGKDQLWLLVDESDKYIPGTRNINLAGSWRRLTVLYKEPYGFTAEDTCDIYGHEYTPMSAPVK
jgi:hypothetical protein